MATITPAALYPVAAPYTTTPSYSGTFIPTLWSSKLNDKFYKASVFGEISNTNWEGDIKGVGDKVIINNIPSITINNYVAGTNLTYEVPTPNTVSLNIDKGKYFAFQIDDVLEYQAQPKLMDVFSGDAGEQMKISIDSTVLYNTFSLAAAANKGATAGVNSASYNLGTDLVPVTLTANNVLSTITALSSVLDEQNVPESDRWLLIDPPTRQWLMSSNLAQAQFMGDNQSMIRNGRIGMIDRFTVYVSNNLPRGAATKTWQSGDGSEGNANSGAEVKRRSIIAGHKSAIAWAAQMTKMETVRNQNQFGDFVRGLNVYGYSVTKPEALAYAVVV
jgi:hypothetical protein